MNSEILSIETSKKLAKYEKIIKEQSKGLEKLRERRTTYHNKYLKEKHKNKELTQDLKGYEQERMILYRNIHDLQKANKKLSRHIDMWNRLYNEEFDKNKKVEEQYERIYEKTKDFGRTQFVKEIQLQINDNKNKDKEIDRLNNIINELEDLLEKMIFDTKKPTVLNNSENMSIRIAVEHIQNKLKELKGDSNE